MAYSDPCSELLCNLMMALLHSGRHRQILALHRFQDQQEQASARKGDVVGGMVAAK